MDHFIHKKYKDWCAILRQKHPEAAIHAYMGHTTGKRATSIDGIYLYRNYQEGLRIFHNEWNPLWAEINAG